MSYRGGGAAEAVAKTGRDEENPVDAAARLVIGLLFAAIPNIAAGAAREAGVSPKVAEEIAAIAHRRAVDSGNGINELFGLGDLHLGLELFDQFLAFFDLLAREILFFFVGGFDGRGHR
ncbi:hypothetical protein F9K50_05005 [bacterium]|nr:MAG: hypothetical protein F9K50_05005 [bacterium]